MRHLLSCILLAYSASSYPCSVPDNQLAKNPVDLVSGATQIVWAKATSMSETQPFKYAKSPVLYTFEIEEILKGSLNTESPKIKGDGDQSGLWDTTFSNHSEPIFATGYNGRIGNIGDCVTTPPPAFKLGQRYLLIIGKEVDSKMYERVDTKDDERYQKVRSLLSQNGI